MSRRVLPDGPDSFQMLPIDEEGGVRGIEQLVRTGQLLEEGDQFLLSRRVQIQSRLVEQENGIFVAFRGFHEKHEIEGEEPLKALAPRLQLDLDAGTSIVGDPDPEIRSIGMIADLMASLVPPRGELRRDVQRGRVQLYLSQLSLGHLLFDHAIGHRLPAPAPFLDTISTQLEDVVRRQPHMLEDGVGCADAWVGGLSLELIHRWGRYTALFK